ncbi:MAG: DUF6600 domain-containing protein [Limisphaerales bacterium]
MFQKFMAGAAVLTALLIGAPFPQNSNAQTESAPTNNPAEAPASGTLPADVEPGSPLAQVVQMAQAGVDASVIKSYVQNSASPFNLTSDQIIYLKDLGLPDDVTAAMIQRDQQLGVAETAQTPPPGSTTEVATEEPEAVTDNYFYDTLSPYGGWVDVDGYGLCWRPTIVIYNPDWQPYCDHGHWVYTDSGWFWLSDYSWGATAFHYGRWFHDARFGWCWWPDTTWGPSWVCWRYSNDYCGWAPLPPHCVYRPGVGMFYKGVAVGAGFDFGISVNFFTFVPTQHFCDPHPRRFRVARGDEAKIYQRTTSANNFGVNRHDRTIVNNGIPPERISAVTKTPVQRLTIRETTGASPHRERLERDTVIVNRPHISDNAAATLNRGVAPPVVRRNLPHFPARNENENNRRAPISGQNNFSRPLANQNPQNRLQPGVPQPNLPQPNRNEQPEYKRRAPMPNNRENNSHAMSPRQQQRFEEQTPHSNPRNFGAPIEHPQPAPRPNPGAPIEHPQPAPRQNYSAPEPRGSPPSRSSATPSNSQGPNDNKDRDHH